MLLKDGFCVDGEKMFGEVKFSALRRSRMVEQDGEVTGEVKSFTYDLRSRAQGQMIQVSIPAESGEKDFQPGTLVELVKPIVGTVSRPTFNGAEVNWFIRAEDIVVKRAGTASTPSQPTQPLKKEEKKG